MKQVCNSTEVCKVANFSCQGNHICSGQDTEPHHQRDMVPAAFLPSLGERMSRTLRTEISCSQSSVRSLAGLRCHTAAPGTQQPPGSPAAEVRAAQGRASPGKSPAPREAFTGGYRPPPGPRLPSDPTPTATGP